MKKLSVRWLSLLLVLCLGCGVAAGAYAAPIVYSIDDAYVKALAIDKLSTRSGPSTAYRETGTYKVKGEWIRLLSYAYDSNGVCWVQCDIPYGDEVRRLYTGLKRFDPDTVDLTALPQENPDDFVTVTALETATALYGPGYGSYGKLTVDRGQRVSLVATMDDWAQVEWVGSKHYRAWIFIGSLDY